MKHKIIVIGLFALLLSGCGMQKFSIGDTSGKVITQDKRKMVHLFWGLVPIGRNQSFPAVPGAKGYIVVTRHNFVDFLVTDITLGIVGMKTIKFEAIGLK